MYYVGFCRICGTGPLGLRTCGACGRVTIVCDECDAVWTAADLSAPPLFSGDADLPCPDCDHPLWGESSRWATREEIEQADWLAAALATDVLTLQASPETRPDSRAG